MTRGARVSNSQTQARQRIVAGAADMMSRRGLSATSIREMAKHADAPLGSTYHYFPDGKQQLAAEAVRYTGERIARRLRRELSAGPAAGVSAFLALWREVVVSTDFRAGCPVLAVAVEEPPTDEIPPALLAAAEIFDDWTTLLETSLRDHGAAPDQAIQVATLIVAAVEGTVALCRAKRSIDPLDHITAQLHQIVINAINPT